MLKNKRIILSGICIFLASAAGRSVFAEENFAYNSLNKRDPFLMLVTPDGIMLKVEGETEKKELMVEGIIHDKSGVSFAIVNGEVVKLGDAVGGYQVLKIEENSVIFVKDGQTKEVVLTKEGN